MKFEFEIPDSDIDYDELWDSTKEEVHSTAQLVVFARQGDTDKMFTKTGIESFLTLREIHENLYCRIQSVANTLAKHIAKIRQTGFHDNFEPELEFYPPNITVKSSYRYRGDTTDSITAIEFPLRYLWMGFDAALAEEQALVNAANVKLAAKAVAETEKKLTTEAEKRRKVFEELKKEFEPK